MKHFYCSKLSLVLIFILPVLCMGISSTVLAQAGGSSFGHWLVFDGMSDQYAYFNGDISYQSGGSATTAAITDNFTLEAWVKYSGAGGAVGQIAYYGGGASIDGYGLEVNTDQTLAILGGAWGWANSTSSLPLNTWAHVAMVRYGGNWHLYLNGTLLTLDHPAYSFFAPGTNDKKFWVGADQSGAPSHYQFTGAIDEVRFSNVVRYTSNFTPPSSPFTSDDNTVALYHFDEGSGTTAYDASGNGNNLTLVNNPTWISEAPLPVQATDFLAKADVNSITLSWVTQSEVDNAGFNVLREDQGTGNTKQGTQNYELIASYVSDEALKGLGTSPSGKNYGFTDSKVKSGLTYEYKIQSVSTDKITEDLVTLSVTVATPKEYALSQNYPNPFNPSTTITYDVPKTSQVVITIYDILGREAETLVNEEQNPGEYKITFSGDKYASGMYFCKMVAGNYTSVKKLVLSK